MGKDPCAILRAAIFAEGDRNAFRPSVVDVIKFLHISDIHLGIRRYRSEERSHDFFLAWRDCIEKYAIAEKVSFVLIAGDFFDSRRVEPQAMNQAITGLELLQQANIPVLVIEGNHDQHEVTSRFSWLRSLSQWGFLKLLEPGYADGRAVYSPWNEETRSGSYIDIDGVRIFGSHWYGAMAVQMVPALIDELRSHRSSTHFNVLMLHTDVEGQLNRPIPAVSVEKLRELKDVVDYLALGHTHKNFAIDGWILNPGSLEACNVEEFDYQRGAYLVEISGGKANARLLEDYYRRPVKRFQFELTGDMTPDAVADWVFERVGREVVPRGLRQGEEIAPVVEIVLKGTRGFHSTLLEVNRLRDRIRKEFDVLLAVLRDKTLPAEYVVAAGLSENVSRAERELRVLQDIISRDARFRQHAVEMAVMMLEMKRMALADDDGGRIAELLEERFAALFGTEEVLSAKC